MSSICTQNSERLENLKKRFVNFISGSTTEPSGAMGFEISMVAIIVAMTSQIVEFTRSAPGQRLNCFAKWIIK